MDLSRTNENLFVFRGFGWHFRLCWHTSETQRSVIGRNIWHYFWRFAICIDMFWAVQYAHTKPVCLLSLPEIIDPVFAKTSPKRSFSMTENERFGLVFTKTQVYKFGHWTDIYLQFCWLFPFLLIGPLSADSCPICWQLPFLLTVALNADSCPFSLQFPILITVALSTYSFNSA